MFIKVFVSVAAARAMVNKQMINGKEKERKKGQKMIMSAFQIPALVLERLRRRRTREDYVSNVEHVDEETKTNKQTKFDQKWGIVTRRDYA